MSNDARSGGASRYDAAVATFVGVLALLVSAYTAHVQRQQVRAQVWPILEVGTSNATALKMLVSNKGVGPALTRWVRISLDGRPLPTWDDWLTRVLGSEKHRFTYSTLAHRVLSAGETLPVLEPRDDNGTGLPRGGPGSAGELINEALRSRITIEICYCSTLGDCWMLIDRPNAPTATEELRRCPAEPADAFRQ